MSSLPVTGLEIEETLKRRHLAINQLKVLTGEQNSFCLNEAYDRCNGNITRAIEYIKNMPDLTGRTKNKNVSFDVAAQTCMEIENSGRADSIMRNKSPKKPDTIDLTKESMGSEEADLQRAIKLSMECSANNVNASQSQTIPPRNRNNSFSGFAFGNVVPQVASDPNLRRRDSPDRPVGLKNIGNTCWFSAVIQPLFNLPIFRSHILQYKGPESMPDKDTEAFRNLCFMQELKKLFALLIGSNQSFIDPTRCVSELQGFIREKSSQCQQQDVSEFTHKLLEWLEDAFKHQATDGGPESPMETDPVSETAAAAAPCPTRNPMVDLFYGEYRAHGINNGSTFTKPQKFGLFPLYVHASDDLHQSLEMSTKDLSGLDGKIENQDGVGQELWFTSLPPVLIFELSRFHYNKKSGEPEKIHSQLDFPNTLYMDRYMESNAERTRKSRFDCNHLRKKLHEVKAELRSRRKMTVGEKSYPIQDILQCCKDFAISRRKRFSENGVLSSRESKKEGLTPTKKSKTIHSEKNSASSQVGAGDGAVIPNEIEAERAATVEEYLKSWMVELEEEKEGLRDEMNNIQKRLESMYDDPALKNHPYVLHAVLVHQGHAVAGHYWAYVRDHGKSRWLKFNDTSVTVSNWDELIADSVGGGNNITSAYCLVYINRNQEELLMGARDGEKFLSCSNELQEIIEKHNTDFANEVEEWDLNQAKLLSLSGAQMEENTFEPKDTDQAGDNKTPESKSDNTPVKQDSSSKHVPSACKEAINSAQTLYETLGAEETLDYEIMNMTMQASMLAIAKAGDTLNLEGPDSALLKVLKQEFYRLRNLSWENTDSTSDPRLHHIAVYMFVNEAKRKVIERTLLEQFADDRLSYSACAIEVVKCAKEKLSSLSSEDLNDEEYQKWQKDYRLFCRATCYLVQGLELCQTGKYADALPYLANVKVENDRICDVTETTKDDMLADWMMASKSVAVCLKNLHKEALEKFRHEDCEQAEGGLNIVEESVVPWIHLLDPNDELLHTIRNDWCSEECKHNLQTKLESALQALLEPPTRPETQAAFHAPTLIRPQNQQDLCDRFHKVMSTMLTTKCR